MSGSERVLLGAAEAEHATLYEIPCWECKRRLRTFALTKANARRAAVAWGWRLDRRRGWLCDECVDGDGVKQ